MALRFDMSNNQWAQLAAAEAQMQAAKNRGTALGLLGTALAGRLGAKGTPEEARAKGEAARGKIVNPIKNLISKIKYGGKRAGSTEEDMTALQDLDEYGVADARSGESIDPSIDAGYDTMSQEHYDRELDEQYKIGSSMDPSIQPDPFVPTVTEDEKLQNLLRFYNTMPQQTLGQNLQETGSNVLGSIPSFSEAADYWIPGTEGGVIKDTARGADYLGGKAMDAASWLYGMLPSRTQVKQSIFGAPTREGGGY
tara:strand:- start:916 stop:1674 length:759 start_codon:yes stop_codon:yes gene_type:complete